MLRWGALVAALLVGCATGAVLRDVVLPARAQGNVTTYAYKSYPHRDLVELGRQADPNLKEMDALDRGLTELGRRGWRIAVEHNDWYVMESRVGP
jgi:hypothetical protein